MEIKPCKTKGGYSVKPDKNVKLDLDKIKSKFNVILETPILLVIKDKYEIIVHQYGELIFKECNDMKFIEDMAKRIYR